MGGGGSVEDRVGGGQRGGRVSGGWYRMAVEWAGVSEAGSGQGGGCRVDESPGREGVVQGWR